MAAARRWRRAPWARLAAAAATLLTGAAWAQADPPAAEDRPANARADSDGAERRWEGAVGLVATWGPEYAGAGASALQVVPAGFVRYGRISISGAGGFTTRRNDDVERGVAARVMEYETVRVRLGLRYDSGRRESGSDRLAGLGDIDGTVRAQLSVNWRPERHWSLTTAVSVDALGRGNGWWAQVGVYRKFPLSSDSAFGVGLSARWAGEDYARRWFGVDAVQAEASGYPVYRPGAGWSDMQLSVRWRTELGPRWATFVGAGLSQQLGPSKASPLTFDPFGWSLGSGLVWRF